MQLMKTIARTAAAQVCLLMVATAGFAANPLNSPTGLAVDTKGNLWVANTGANNVVEFTSKYAFESAGTITQAIHYPTGLAFDPAGSLWVANFFGGGVGNVTEYTGGVQNTSNTISQRISFPRGIAIDALSSIWVNNNSMNVTVYAAATEYGAPTGLVRTIAPYGDVLCLTVSRGVFSYASSSTVYQNAETIALATGALAGSSIAASAVALASDSSGNLYFAGSHGVVVILPANRFFLQLPFVPAGMAIDSVRGRVYFSNATANSISVYSTAGVLLKTIE